MRVIEIVKLKGIMKVKIRLVRIEERSWQYWAFREVCSVLCMRISWTSIPLKVGRT